MGESHFLLDVVGLLAAVVVFVPVAQRLGLGSVLGYLLAGLALGPWGIGFVGDPSRISQVSEFGVVFLLFVIGLELEPRRLWNWRVPIFGMGTAQLVLVTGLAAAVSKMVGLSWSAGFVIGAGCALSSTAIASQVLRDRNLMGTPGGSSAFSILLFQDMAVIPILAALPLIAGVRADHHGPSILAVLGTIIGVIFAGHFFLRHVLRLVASAHLREVFTALSLLLVVGLAALMHSVGVSMALGAFLGGVLLANSEYRRAIETDIEPFKGLFLGLFFMSVGMAVNVGTLADRPGLLVAVLSAVLVVKIVSHAAIGWIFGLTRKERPLFAILLSQIGEFAFVLFATASTLGILNAEETAILSAAVALSMATTPLLLSAYDRWIAPRLARINLPEQSVENDHPVVLIAGFGRVGQIVGRLLYANRIRATVLDHDAAQIEILRSFGFKIYYGDATRLDLLRAAGAETAKILVVAVDDQAAALEIVDMAKEHFPHLRIISRARNVAHAYELVDRGVRWERETFDSSLRMGTGVLEMLGLTSEQAANAGQKFRDHNLKMIEDLAQKRGDRDQLISAAKQAREDLENMFDEERKSLRRQDEGFQKEL